MADKNFPNKFKLGEYITPVGGAVYPHLITPDTKWKAEGEYRSKLKYDGKVAEKIRKDLTPFLDEAFEKYKELLVEHGKKAKVKGLTKADLPLKPEEDEDGEETGFYLLNTKRTASGKTKKGESWKAKIVIADSKGKPVSTKGLSIWSGTELRVMAKVMAWYNAKDNEVGITLEIQGVQIRKLVSGGDGAVEFDEMEDADNGWVANDDAPDADDDEDADAAGDEGDDADDTPDF